MNNELSEINNVNHKYEHISRKIKNDIYKQYKQKYFVTTRVILGFAKISFIFRYCREFWLTRNDTPREVLAQQVEGGKMLEKGQHNRGRGTPASKANHK